MNQIYLGNTLINDAFLGADRMVTLQTINFDAAAVAFFTATGITNEGLKVAINKFIVSLKQESLWDKMTQILPFVADNTVTLGTQFSYNLKNTAAFNPTFIGGVTDSNLNGYKAVKQSTRYIVTNLFPYTEFVNNGHVCIYTTDALQDVGQELDTWDWGINPTQPTYPTPAPSVVIVGRNTPDGGGNVQKIANLASNTDVFVGANPAAGCYIASFFNVSSTSTTQFMQNGSVIGSSTGTYRRPTDGLAAYFGATNQNGSSQARSNRRYQLLTVGAGLTEAEMGKLNTIVFTFQNNIDAALGTTRSV